MQQIVNDRGRGDDHGSTLRATFTGRSRPRALSLSDEANRLSTTGRDWWERQAEGLAQRIGDSLMVGVSLEESLTQLTQRVRGTSEQGFQDGIMAKARQDASRLLTTQMTNTIGEARVAVAESECRRPGADPPIIPRFENVTHLHRTRRQAFYG